MSLSLNKPKLDNLANEIWKSAERLRGKFSEYSVAGFLEQAVQEMEGRLGNRPEQAIVQL